MHGFVTMARCETHHRHNVSVDNDDEGSTTSGMMFPPGIHIIVSNNVFYEIWIVIQWKTVMWMLHKHVVYQHDGWSNLLDKSRFVGDLVYFNENINSIGYLYNWEGLSGTTEAKVRSVHISHQLGAVSTFVLNNVNGCRMKQFRTKQ